VRAGRTRRARRTASFWCRSSTPRRAFYALQVSTPGGQRSHVFAVADSDVFVQEVHAAPADNSALVMIAVLGGVLLVAIVVTVVLGLRRRQSEPDAAESEET